MPETLRTLSSSFFVASGAFSSRASATKKKEVAGALVEKAPDAAKKLELNGHKVSSITKDEIKGLLFKVYNKSVSGIQSKLKKPDFVKALEKEFRENIGRYEEYIATLELESVTP